MFRSHLLVSVLNTSLFTVPHSVILQNIKVFVTKAILMAKYAHAITTDAFVSALFSPRITEQFSRQYKTHTEARITDSSVLPTYIKKAYKMIH
jgi:uncharacterized protein YacL